LATQNIYSKVISVPCQEIFEKQNKNYKEKILNETKYKCSIEAGSTDCWKKYLGNDGISFGINEFGKSAPYKDVYQYFGLTAEKIIMKIKKIIDK
jgi:transketolase